MSVNFGTEMYLERIANALERIAAVLEKETEAQGLGTLPSNRNIKTDINVIAETLKRQ